MKRSQFLALGSICLLLSVGHTSSQVHSKQEALTRTDSVRASVFQYQLSKFGHRYRPYVNLYFLGIEEKSGGDPSPAVMRSLQSKNYSVKGTSQSVSTRYGVFDKKTKAPGLSFDVTDIRFLSTSKAKARGSIYQSPSVGEAADYTIELIHGKWKVTKCHVTVVY